MRNINANQNKKINEYLFKNLREKKGNFAIKEFYVGTQKKLSK